MYLILTNVPDFSKLRSAGLNYHLLKLSFFTDPYYVGGGGGVFNKHCLLTFFVFINIDGFLL